MSDSKDTVQIPTEKLLEAFLHSKQFEQHYATQESVDNLKERINERFDAQDAKFAKQESLDNLKDRMNERFEQADKRFDATDKRIEKLDGKIDRIQWLIVSASLVIIFKEQLMKLFA